MFKRILTVFACAALVAVAFAGCQGASSSSAGTNGNTVIGQVTSIDGNKITIKLADNQFAGQNQQGPQNSGQRPQMPDTMPSGGQWQGGGNPFPSGGQMPPSGSNPRGGFGMKFTGESKTINVTDSTAITTGGMRQNQSAAAASLSDIKVDSIIFVTLTGDTATAITIMEFGNRGGAGPSPGESPSPEVSPIQQTLPPPSPSPQESAGGTPSVGAQITF